MTTKESIIYQSLVLFSSAGYDSVSTRMIARAIHASDAVIYKHFKNKQEILDTIVSICKERFLSKSASANLDTMCWKDVEGLCMDMFEFQTQDEWIVMFRKLLIVEQYKNPQMATLYREFFIYSPVNFMAGLFQELMNMGYMKEGNPQVYAMELYAPFFLYHTVGQEGESLLDNLKLHVTNFKQNVMTEKCYKL